MKRKVLPTIVFIPTVIITVLLIIGLSYQLFYVPKLTIEQKEAVVSKALETKEGRKALAEAMIGAKRNDP